MWSRSGQFLESVQKCSVDMLRPKLFDEFIIVDRHLSPISGDLPLNVPRRDDLFTGRICWCAGWEMFLVAELGAIEVNGRRIAAYEALKEVLASLSVTASTAFVGTGGADIAIWVSIVEK